MLAGLEQWAAAWPRRVWAIEGASGLGRLLAQQLVAAGQSVGDAPSALGARSRVLACGHGRKTDGIDARSVALVAQHCSDLHTVAADDHTAILRLLSDRRDELTGERRRTINRLHRVLRDLHPGGAARQLTADRATQLLRAIRPANAIDQNARRSLASSSPTSAASTAPSSRTADAASRPSPPPAVRSPRSSASATSSPPRSSATPVTSPASPAPITT